MANKETTTFLSAVAFSKAHTLNGPLPSPTEYDVCWRQTTTPESNEQANDKWLYGGGAVTLYVVYYGQCIQLTKDGDAKRK